MMLEIQSKFSDVLGGESLYLPVLNMDSIQKSHFGYIGLISWILGIGKVRMWIWKMVKYPTKDVKEANSCA